MTGNKLEEIASFSYKVGDLTGPTTVKYGDVNNDGAVLSDDAQAALEAAVQMEGKLLEGDAFIAADVTGDGTILADDAQMILERAVQLPVTFPVELK